MKKMARNLIKRILPEPVKAKLRKIRGRWLQRDFIQKILRERNNIFIEVGCANKGKNGWLTLDMCGSPDIYWDLRRGLPFPDGSVSKIYSSHLFEHLAYKEIQALLDECKRVLIPDGIFSICVPNARLYIEAYFKSEGLDRSKLLVYKPALNETTKIDYINYVAYMDGHHKYMFDEENLLCILKLKGFRHVHLRSFDPGLDRPERDYESIYAQAQK